MTSFRVIAAAAAALSASAGAALAGDVVVTVTDVQARGGALYGALQAREQFMQPTFTRGAVRENPTAGTVELVFRDVPPGDYAVSVLHDEDGDRQMGMNGYMPREGYAMLRSEELRSQPSFDTVRVAVPTQGGRFTTAMRYLDGRMPGAPAR